MCYYYQPIQKNAFEVYQKRYNAEFPKEEFYGEGFINGFAYPQMPVIMDESKNHVSLAKWGLLPFWVKDDKDFLKKSNTLNAMIETAAEKPSYKNYVNNRCLVLASSFKEWKHETIDGKLVKVPFEITTPEKKPFAMAGLYSIWNGTTTFTILTAPANELMAEIHNSKKRMPVILCEDEEILWMSREPLEPYCNRSEIELIATQVQ